ncbi:putative voltage gated chloride channel protein [Escherichia coli]|uniref:Putative voltage gated chloride channel protein n=1 Tax=Escherichia coli TaxID=562 RepID=A0A3S4K7S2_ECOLX|nr:putative voltage gated chloride channel protein [Escherichia coli]
MLHPRARTMLLLSLPAVAIGIASSLILIVVMKIASVLQNLLWQRLPGTLGIAQDSPFWIIAILTLTGIAVGLVIRFSQGHAGPDPACEPLIGAPVPPSALPGLIVALILGLAGGVSLGPEHPIMTVNIALAVAIGARLLPARQPNGVDYFSLCRHHRRAVWHTCCGGVDIFANLKWQ